MRHALSFEMEELTQYDKSYTPFTQSINRLKPILLFVHATIFSSVFIHRAFGPEKMNVFPGLWGVYSIVQVTFAAARLAS